MNLPLELVDLHLKCIIFSHLVPEKPHCQFRLLLNPARSKQVKIGALALAVSEVICLYRSLLDQSLQAIVGLAEIDAQALCG